MNNRTAAFVLTFLLLLLLTGCREKPSPICTITYMDQEYTLDQVKQTITHSGDVYHYQFSGNEITLEYPNQATYSQTDYGGSIASGWTENYDDARYVPGDVLIGISTSGNAKNVMYAMTVAKALGMKTIGLTGKDGGALKREADVSVVVPETETFKIQELHLPVYHALCLMLEEHFYEV